MESIVVLSEDTAKATPVSKIHYPDQLASTTVKARPSTSNKILFFSGREDSVDTVVARKS